jgi:hypothetical protein
MAPPRGVTPRKRGRAVTNADQPSTDGTTDTSSTPMSMTYTDARTLLKRIKTLITENAVLLQQADGELSKLTFQQVIRGLQVEIKRNYQEILTARAELQYAHDHFPRVFSSRVIDQLKDYMSYLKVIINIKSQDLRDQWKPVRETFVDALGIDFSFSESASNADQTITPTRIVPVVNPQSLFADLIPDQAANLRTQPTTTVSDQITNNLQQIHQAGIIDESNFICKEPLRSQLLTEGISTINMELGGKSLTAYISENIVQQVHKVSGNFESKRISVPDLWGRFQDVHMAPSSQLPHFSKIQALFMCLEDEAYDAVSGYRSSSNRLSYLECWKILFELFGNQETEISKNLEAIGTASVLNTSWRETVKFLIKINSHFIRLKHLNYDQNRSIDRVWNAITTHLSDKFKKYVWTKNPEFDGNILAYVNTNPIIIFETFRTWCVNKNATENSLPETGIHALRVGTKRTIETASEAIDQQVKIPRNTQTNSEPSGSGTSPPNCEEKNELPGKPSNEHDPTKMIHQYLLDHFKTQQTPNQGGLTPNNQPQQQGGNVIPASVPPTQVLPPQQTNQQNYNQNPYQNNGQGKQPKQEYFRPNNGNSPYPGNQNNANQVPYFKGCWICKLLDHKWYNCPVLDINIRVKVFTDEKLCQNCGKAGHSKQQCRSKVRCMHCRDERDPKKGFHHSAICFRKYGTPNPTPTFPQNISANPAPNLISQGHPVQDQKVPHTVQNLFFGNNQGKEYADSIINQLKQEPANATSNADTAAQQMPAPQSS